MNCINHTSETAIAICMACGAGLCQGCSKTIIEGKHVCNNESCAAISLEERKAITELVSKNRVGYKLLPPFLALMGIVFIIFSVFECLTSTIDVLVLFIFTSGCAFEYFAFYLQRELNKKTN